MTQFQLFTRSLWLAIRRLPRGSVSPRQLVVLTFCLAYLLGYGLLLRQQYRESGPWGIGFSAVIGALGLLVAGFIRRNNAHADDSLLKLSAHTSPAADDLRAHGAVLARTLLRTAAMVDRAGAEAIFSLGKSVPEHAGICRRRTLDLATRPELWDGFSSEEQDLLRSQEGSWAWEHVWPRIVQAEDVRVLRWTLGMDEVLTPFEFLTPDLSPALAVTLKPDQVSGDACLAAYDLRPEETIAQVMMSRCAGEGIRRGVFDESDPELRKYFVDFAEKVTADAGMDLLVGTQTVAEATAERVQWIAQAALRRVRVFAKVIAYLNGPADAVVSIK